MSPRPNKFRILVDEDIHIDITHFLKSEGHDVIPVPKGTQNGSMYKMAVATRRMLLTGDKDLSNSVLYPPENTKGIMLIRIHPPKPENIIPVLTKALNSLSPKKLKGKLATLDRSGIWLE